jgi:hypothetical protein
MKVKKKIELVKCHTLLRYDERERLEIHNDFYEILKKHKFAEHTRIPTHALMDFLYKWFDELPVFPNDFDKLNKDFPFQVDWVVEKEYL